MRGSIETRVGIFVLVALMIFGYMGFQTGAFRFDRFRYNTYIVYFKDITGLARKGDVKIAGVKVGWVKQVTLVADEAMPAQVELMVSKDYALYVDAYAVVRQDGLLGPRYVELIPGDPYSRRLQTGDSLVRPSTDPVSIDELLLQFKQIAKNVNAVTESFKTAVGNDEGKDRLLTMVENMSLASERISSFAQTLDRSFVRNADSIDALLDVGTDIKHLSRHLEDNVLPAFQGSLESIATTFDRDFDRVATKIESVSESLEDISAQARDGMYNIVSVAQKVNDGKGLIGKLINDDESYRDFKTALQGLKNYVTKLEHLKIVCDSHSESMHRRAEYYRHEDFKGYFDLKIYPNQDHFYMIQFVGSEKGYVHRKDVDRHFYDMESPETYPEGSRFDVRTLPPSELRPQDFLREYEETYHRNTTKLGLQFGKVFGDMTFRCGLFEGSA